MRRTGTGFLPVLILAAVAAASTCPKVTKGSIGLLGREPWPTDDPFLFCAYHNDAFPAKGRGSALGPERDELRGRSIGSDFSYMNGWSMYHGDTVPGFPQHPHYGFETVTLALRGLVDHFDSMGATGRYGHGDVQWMTAGGGVQHSEMFPLTRNDSNPLELYQLWLNLPKARKSATPYFAMQWAEDMPIARMRGVNVTVVAGAFGGVAGLQPPPDSWAATAEHNVMILVINVTLDSDGPTGVFHLDPAAGPANRVLYFVDGPSGSSAMIAAAGDGCATEATMSPHQMQRLVSNERTAVSVRMSSGGAEGSPRLAKFLVLQGKPINEQVVQRGPFVTSSNAEMQHVHSEYQRTQFGGWPWPSADYTHAESQDRFARRGAKAAAEYPSNAGNTIKETQQGSPSSGDEL